MLVDMGGKSAVGKNGAKMTTTYEYILFPLFPPLLVQSPSPKIE
jgi:hypothetical protein